MKGLIATDLVVHYIACARQALAHPTFSKLVSSIVFCTILSNSQDTTPASELIRKKVYGMKSKSDARRTAS